VRKGKGKDRPGKGCNAKEEPLNEQSPEQQQQQTHLKTKLVAPTTTYK